MASKLKKGFTLIELVIVIVLTSIVAAVVAPLIGNKFGAVADSLERAKWVEQAEFVFLKMRQDLSNSVPNSAFASEPSSGANQVVEMLAAPPTGALYAARYRNRNYNPYDRLQINNDDSFDIFTTNANVPNFVSIGLDNPTEMRTDWESVRAGGSNGSIAAVDTGSVTSGTAENSSPIVNIVLTASHNFRRHSPFYRAYFTDGPVAYQCDSATGFVYRVSQYNNLSAASDFFSRSAAGTRNRVMNQLIACEFTILPGTPYSPPTLYVRLEVGNQRESIELFDAIPLSNGS